MSRPMEPGTSAAATSARRSRRRRVSSTRAIPTSIPSRRRWWRRIASGKPTRRRRRAPGTRCSGGVRRRASRRTWRAGGFALAAVGARGDRRRGPAHGRRGRPRSPPVRCRRRPRVSRAAGGDRARASAGRRWWRRRRRGRARARERRVRRCPRRSAPRSSPPTACARGCRSRVWRRCCRTAPVARRSRSSAVAWTSTPTRAGGAPRAERAGSGHGARVVAAHPRRRRALPRRHRRHARRRHRAERRGADLLVAPAGGARRSPDSTGASSRAPARRTRALPRWSRARPRRPSRRRPRPIAIACVTRAPGATDRAIACFQEQAASGGLTAEVALLEIARLRRDVSGDLGGAERALDEYRRRFPRGTLSAEAGIARVELLLRLGRAERGAGRGARAARGRGRLLARGLPGQARSPRRGARRLRRLPGAAGRDQAPRGPATAGRARRASRTRKVCPLPSPLPQTGEGTGPDQNSRWPRSEKTQTGPRSEL